MRRQQSNGGGRGDGSGGRGGYVRRVREHTHVATDAVCGVRPRLLLWVRVEGGGHARELSA